MSKARVFSSALVALLSIVSMNFGASWAKHLMLDVGANGAAWLRFVMAATSLSVISLIARVSRPSRRTMPLREWPWRLVILYSAALLLMNWTIYHSFFHLPVGLGVAIELLGPLTLAVIGSRGFGDYFWVFLAGAGVLLLGFQPQASLAGIVWALLAAIGWAGYIHAGSKVVGPEPIHLLLFTYVVGTLVLGPFALPELLSRELTSSVWFSAALVGVFSAALPYSLELMVLRRIPARLFSILQASAPAVAALLAWLVIGERIGPMSWVAIVAVMTASVGATISTSRNSQPSRKDLGLPSS